MVKSYLKFEQAESFGQICSTTSNCIWDPRTEQDTTASRSSGGRAFVGANEDVLVWDIKRGEAEGRWHATDNRAQVTVIVRSQADPDIFAVGYDDGKIRLWDSRLATILSTFNGHKSAITQLAFDQTGGRLVSGSRDTDIILWDLIEEVGLFKLRGHKDQITSLNFLSSTPSTREDGDSQLPDIDADNFLLSTSKDALIKIWDLSTQHCIETHVAQNNGECWALGLSSDKDGCITAGNDGEMRAWILDKEALHRASRDLGSEEKVLKDRGTFYRNGKDRTTAVAFHPKRDLLAFHGSEKAVELWRIRSEDEIRKSIIRKRKRKREKLGEDAIDAEDSKEVDMANVLITEVFVPYVTVRTAGRVRSMDWAGGKSSKSLSILVATTNNQLELYDVTAKEKKSKEQPDYNRALSVDMPGHRSDIRCLALSADDRMLASASQGSLKIWNTRTKSCLRTLDCGYALCATFLPGDKIVVIGTREGKLEIFDIASSNLLDTIDAHERDIWSLHVNPDGKSLVTGSADKTAKFWDLKVIQEEVLGTNRKMPKLTLVHARTLKTADDILAVRFSPDSKYLALSTLDTTVKVFYTDSLKLYLTLYGHKLPVLGLDVSYDSKLVVTSSADKTVRIWGLDFGDCHKTFFAHNDSILTVGFIPNNDDGNGHHFFSASKDRTIKYYDADKFEQIQKLEGHHGEIWALAIAHSGQFIATASHDKSIRIWQQTDEQIFLEEEREKELEELYENTLLTSLEQDDSAPGDDPNAIETTDATKQSSQTLIASEKITEALTLGVEDLGVMADYNAAVLRAKQNNTKPPAPPARNPIYLANNNISATSYLLSVFTKLPPQHLTDSLLLLSFSQLPALFTFLTLFTAEQRNIPLVCRILNFMLKVHNKQIVSSRLMKRELEELRAKLREGMDKSRRDMGFNLAGLRVLGRRMTDEVEGIGFVDGEEEKKEVVGKGRKRAFVNIA
ncbi:beta transducin [Neophaeococcomyces mojaviensis]|uniref:Beta transducin n=1 Tax=Neophaeococcomyces mojaviensis TaxID=3383035 RepID=A0ACC2ZUT0_9EURO|nr:beta transducin [Knufia sp. JES_112]